MANLLQRNPNPAARGRLFTNPVTDVPQEAEVYNRSSLALDPDNPAPSRHPVSHVVAWPNAVAAGIAPQGPLWRGQDPFAYKRSRATNVTSFIIHACAISALLWLGFQVRVVMPTVKPIHATDITLYAPPPPPKVLPVAPAQGGGGGGGAHHIIEPTRGRPPVVQKSLPVLAPQIIRIERPKLAAEPTMQVKIPDSTKLPNLGMAQSPQIALASQGRGGGSGFGAGLGGGIGSGRGVGSGPGSGGGFGGGVMSVGGGVSAPVLIHSVEPEFTAEARAANFQGSVSVQLIIDSAGNPQNAHIVRHLGMGLDEKALEAIRSYRFRPAMYEGHPVAVQMIIDVAFHLH